MCSACPYHVALGRTDDVLLALMIMLMTMMTHAAAAAVAAAAALKPSEHVNIHSTLSSAGPAVLRGTRIFMLRHRICCLPRNLLLATENVEVAIFATLSNLRFFRLLFNFTIYKTIKLVIVSLLLS